MHPFIECEIWLNDADVASIPQGLLQLSGSEPAASWQRLWMESGADKPRLQAML